MISSHFGPRVIDVMKHGMTTIVESLIEKCCDIFQNKPHFCKENGITYDNWETVQPPHDVRKMISTFVNRCNKYYKV